MPVFAHLPLILNPDGTKMSKRKSQTAVADYIAQGFTREALVNYFAFLGWSPGTEEDVLALDELVERFELDKVQKGGARFDRERLEWLNGQWIRRLDDDDLVDRLLPFLEARRVPAEIDRIRPTDELRALLPIIRERIPTLASIVELVGLPVERRARARPGGDRPQALGRGDDTRGARPPRATILAAHDAVTWEADELEPPLRALVEARGWKAGDLFMAIRVADHRPDRDAAAVRHAGRPRAGSGRSPGSTRAIATLSADAAPTLIDVIEFRESPDALDGLTETTCGAGSSRAGRTRQPPAVHLAHLRGAEAVVVAVDTGDRRRRRLRDRGGRRCPDRVHPAARGAPGVPRPGHRRGAASRRVLARLGDALQRSTSCATRTSCRSTSVLACRRSRAMGWRNRAALERVNIP